ncbi:MAG: hypothetical protein H6695_09545 [Deferribacteres bacterium]|nr:hypothetical protein [candidate division KSB1 bacterium]MCB9510415.1 hypothetical protein [Deferribacteres bacterium]
MKKYQFPLIACLTLGLAPFVPEPHIVGKIRWIIGGAHGMAAIDWFDTVLHGAPWLVLLFLLARDGIAKLRAKKRA